MWEQGDDMTRFETLNYIFWLKIEEDKKHDWTNHVYIVGVGLSRILYNSVKQQERKMHRCGDIEEVKSIHLGDELALGPWL